MYGQWPVRPVATANVTMLMIGPLTITVPAILLQVTDAQTVAISGVSVTDPSLPTTNEITLDLATSGGSLFLATNVPGGVTSGEVSPASTPRTSRSRRPSPKSTRRSRRPTGCRPRHSKVSTDRIPCSSSRTIQRTLVTSQIPLQIASPPEIRKVAVDSTSWSQSFEQQFSSHNVDTTPGYVLPAGQTQLADLPWSGLNEIRLQFTEDVNVQQNSLTVTGLNVPSYAISGFSYSPSEPGRRVDAFPADRRRSCADSSRLDRALRRHRYVGQSARWRLDEQRGLPSGNGQAGGDFNFSINVLPGDANQDGIVNSQDIALLSSSWLASPQSGFFDPAIDSNGDGIVNTQDLALLSANWLKALPAQATGNSLALGVSMELATGASQPANAPASLTAIGSANPATIESQATVATISARCGGIHRRRECNRGAAGYGQWNRAGESHDRGRRETEHHRRRIDACLRDREQRDFGGNIWPTVHRGPGGRDQHAVVLADGERGNVLSAARYGPRRHGRATDEQPIEQSRLARSRLGRGPDRVCGRGRQYRALVRERIGNALNHTPQKAIALATSRSLRSHNSHRASLIGVFARCPRENTRPIKTDRCRLTGFRAMSKRGGGAGGSRRGMPPSSTGCRASMHKVWLAPSAE